jgi:3-oxoacyl-[acyl-carrier protein] reductase
MDLGLTDARVLVVGGSRGMGRAAAESFAAEGASVAVLARPSRTLNDAAAALKSKGSPDAINLTSQFRPNSTLRLKLWVSGGMASKCL